MKRTIFILLLVIFVIFLSCCNDSSDMAVLNMSSSTVENSGATESIPQKSQAGSAADASTPAHNATTPALAAPGASAQGTVPNGNSVSQAVGSGTTPPDLPEPPPVKHEITLPVLIPAYTTEENILSNTLARCLSR